MRKMRAPSPATKTVLKTLFEAPAGLHGYDISKSTGIGAGTLYPILVRLEDRDLLASQWETNAQPGRPPRHIYSLTEQGKAFVESVLTDAEKDQQGIHQGPQPA